MTGRVQGVGFRMSVVHTASQLGLVGWTRNRSDGSVEVWAQGDLSSLERLAEFLRAGPPFAKVLDVRWVSVPADPSLSGFVVAPSG